MSKNLFLIKKPKPSINLSFCVFLDILGFTNDILINSKNETSDDHLKLFHKEFNKARKLLLSENRIWETRVFTDNVLLGSAIHSIRNLDDEDYFGLMIGSIQEYQLSMVLNNHFIRGGWSIGELYIDNNIIYGESLIEAYQIETKYADVPRILFSDKMMGIIRKHLNYYAKDYFAPHKFAVLKDEDGKYFVNYLYEIIIESDVINYKALEKHKTVVEDSLKKHKKNIHILNKYRWVAEYHNYFCDTYLNKCNAKYYIDISTIQRKFSLIP